MTQDSIKSQIAELSEKLRQYQKVYYEGRPTVSDREYDRLFDLLQDLETRNPEFRFPDSPTQRVGSDLSNDFPEVEHQIPVLSLDKAYDLASLEKWMEKNRDATEGHVSFTIEEKIDGISLVLYYRNGVLDQAVTRGNGRIGNEITANAKTIFQIPLQIPDTRNFIVRGEVYLPISVFQEINTKLETPFANPRNFAGGTIRRIKSSDVAKIPLRFFAYEGFLDQGPESYLEIYELLQQWGFSVNHRYLHLEDFAESSMHKLTAFVEKERVERDTLDYQIDGLVLKINELSLREELGYTGHHPRWAIAFKFDSPQAVSVVRTIDVQVGRTGRITPVARIELVEIGGSVVSNATLHNQDYVNSLELAVGDTVAVSKRGDVIPAVEKVIEKGDQSLVWQMPENYPSCGSVLAVNGAHLFCSNRSCPDILKGRLKFFVGRSQMDIDGCGAETVDFLFENLNVRSIADLFTFNIEKLLDFPGFGEKKIEILKRGLEEAKKKPYSLVLPSLGYTDLGPKAVELIIEAGLKQVEDLFHISDSGNIDRLIDIHGLGEKTAKSIILQMGDEKVRQEIKELMEKGLQFHESSQDIQSTEKEVPQIFNGQRWCVTGSFEHFKPRELASKEIKRRGGKTVSAVSGSTTHLLAGEKAGSKLQKAESLGVTIVSEQQFLEMIDG